MRHSGRRIVSSEIGEEREPFADCEMEENSKVAREAKLLRRAAKPPHKDSPKSHEKIAAFPQLPSLKKVQNATSFQKSKFQVVKKPKILHLR